MKRQQRQTLKEIEDMIRCTEIITKCETRIVCQTLKHANLCVMMPEVMTRAAIWPQHFCFTVL